MYFCKISDSDIYPFVLHLSFYSHLKAWSWNTITSSVLLGLSKFAKLARSVTRSRSVLVSQFSSHMPNIKDTAKQSHLAHVSTVEQLEVDINS
jgi:potassium voltage-gated channel Eag-related subfamily H protein